MPLYEYQCDACGHRFEVIQRYSDAPIATCEKCGGPVQKLLSSPAIQFKGSGWYITDYARAGKTDTAATASGKNDSNASSSETKSESKSDAKSDGKSEPKSETKTESKSDAKPTPPSTS
jgi:putative FmdB family regulatory protein